MARSSGDSTGTGNVTDVRDLATTDKPVPKPKADNKAVLVHVPQSEYVDFMKKLELIHALLGGTYELRQLCDYNLNNKYLPAEPAEKENSYWARVNRTVLFNAFLRTRQKLVGEVFGKDVTLNENMSDEEEVWMENIDLKGNDINTFASTVFAQAMSDGVTYLLADYPQADLKYINDKLFYKTEDGKWMPFTKAAEKKLGWRPYLVHVKADQVIGLRTENVEGKRVITQIRIHEFVEEENGPYDTKQVEKIRVLEPGFYEIWRKPDNNNKVWILESSGITSTKEITLVQIQFGEELNNLEVIPPMSDLAYLNLNHFQSTSDQKNILHYARMIVWFGKMLTKDKNDEIEMGANRLVHSDDPLSDLKVVEHNGQAITAGRNDLKDTEYQMAMFGLTLMIPKTRNITATEKTIDSNENDSSLLNWTRIAEDGFNTAIQYMNDIVGNDSTKAGTLDFNKEFRNFLRAEDALIILNAVERNLLPMELMFTEFKRRGIITDEWDLVEIKQMLEQQVQRDTDIGGLSFNFTGRRDRPLETDTEGNN